LIDVHQLGDSFFFRAAFFALALLVRAMAAAREALSALWRRCSGVIALARAKPPLRPTSIIAWRNTSLSILSMPGG
jgi:hypothetical protein